MFETKHKTGIPTKKYAFVSAYVIFVGLLFAGLSLELLKDDASPEPEHTPSDQKDTIETVVRELRSQTPNRTGAAIRQQASTEPTEIEQAEPAWKREAATWQTSANPKIAIIIDDLGMTESATGQLAAIDGPLTMAFLPYAPNLEPQTRLMRRAGHELMLHLPMQSQQEDVDHGENALLKGLSYEEFNRRLSWNLSQFSGYVGVNNHMGSGLTEDAGQMVRLMQRLNENGHLFIDSLTTSKSVGADAAKAANVPYAARDVFLDNVRDEAYIKRQLNSAERIAKTRGYAVAIGHPYPETINVLREWRKTNDARGIILVPASQIVLEAMEWRVQRSR